MTTILTSKFDQRVAAKAELKSQVDTVKSLIEKLVPQGNYADYLDIAGRLKDLEFYWDLIRIRLRYESFRFKTQIDALRADTKLIYGDYIATELEKADQKDVHGFVRRIDEVGNDLRAKKNVYTQFPEIDASLKKIVQLQRDIHSLKIHMNTSYGRSVA